MKKRPSPLLAAALAAFFLQAGAVPAHASDEGYNAITGHFAERNFIAGPFSRSQLTQILHAGSRAPSARNAQPWHFTVVRTLELGRQILPDFQDGNVLIIVSAPGDGKTSGAAMLDCGLAVENMYLAAQALGLGSRIYTGPVDAINRSMKEALAFPGGHSAVALVRVGQANLGPDAVSGPSARNTLTNIVTYK
jgi:nitroreductase